MITAGGGLLQRLGSFQGILIDEVAQSTEPSAVVPIVARNCQRLALLGEQELAV